MNKYKAPCAECGKTFPKRELASSDGQRLLCVGCYDGKFFICDDCGASVPGGNISTVLVYGNEEYPSERRRVCPECEDAYECCPECGALHDGGHECY